MMQTTNTDSGALSAGYTAICSDRWRPLATQVHIMWDGNNWTNETANVINHSGTFQLQPPGSTDLLAAGDVGQATVTLRNAGYRYSEHSSRGDASLRNTILTEDKKLKGIEIRIWQGFYTSGTPESPADDEYVQIFHGVIYDWDENTAQKSMTLFCRDIGQKYLQQRANTVVEEYQRLDQWIETMADAAGIPGGDRNLDVSIYTVPWLWMADESPIEEIWTAAEADGGRVYFDHHGQLIFENALNWLDHTASTWTLDADDFTNLFPDPQTEALASEVQAEWSPRFEAMATTIYQLEELKRIRPGETLTFDITFSRPVVRMFELTAEDDYQFINAAGGDMNSHCTLEIPDATRYSQRATVNITNNHGHYSAMLIYLDLRGTILVGGNSQEITIPVDPAPIDVTVTRWLRGNMLLQSDSHTRALATYLSENTCASIQKIWNLAGVRGIPQLELGDRITFSDDRIVGSTRDGLVTRIAWNMSESNGFVQDLQVIDAEGLFPYDDYFTIGVDTLGSNERAYY